MADPTPSPTTTREAVLAAAKRMLAQGLVEGTAGTEKGQPNTKVWSERAKFDDAAKKMQGEVAKLAAAARSNNLDTLKAAFGNAAGTCKACHDDFRNQ